MAEENPTYDEILKENEDLLLRNSELELENSVLREDNRRDEPSSPPKSPLSPEPHPEPPPKPDSPEPEQGQGRGPLGKGVDIEVELDDMGIELDFETGAKVVRIKTEEGKTMYTVSFLANPDGTFIVKVWKFGNLVVPVEIVRNVYPPEERNVAKRQFGGLIKDYSNLVKSETEEIDPKTIFDECVGYRIVDPDCCRNCQFSRKPENPKGKWIAPNKPRTYCVNRKNIAQYEKILRDFDKTFFANMPLSCDGCPPETPFPGGGKENFRFSGLDPETYPSPQPFPPYSPPVEIDMKVVVDPRGVCRNYVRKGKASPGRFDDGKSLEFDKDLLNIINNMVEDKIGRIQQEDVVVYCGGSEETGGR